MPNGTSSSSLTANWYDSAVSLQAASPIANTTLALTSTGSSFNPTLSAKRFNSDGAMAFYQILVTPSANLDQNARIYVEFPYPIPAALNREKYLECYTRITNTNIDDAASYTYCSLIGERRVVIWNNRIVSSGGSLYIDIFGVSQPRAVNITGSSYISVSIDIDTDYTNGVSQYGEMADSTPTGAPTNVIVIQSTSMSSLYIRALQDVSVTFSFAATGKLSTAGKKVYIVFPASYAIWVNRGATLTSSDCILNAFGTATNLATACRYISQRILAITTASDSSQKYTATIKSVKASPFLPQELANSIRFSVFLATNDELGVTDYSYEDKSSALSLISNTDLIDLSWLSYIVTQTNSSLNLNQISSGTVYIFKGYFSRIT